MQNLLKDVNNRTALCRVVLSGFIKDIKLCMVYLTKSVSDTEIIS